MGDEQAHQVAVANSVNGLHNDLVESEAGWQLLSWDRSHPVHPVTSLLVKKVVMHATVLQQLVNTECRDRKHSESYSTRFAPNGVLLTGMWFMLLQHRSPCRQYPTNMYM